MSETPFHFEFDELGGCDAMTSAYNIMQGDILICCIDVGNYVEGDSWEECHSENEQARAMAFRICDSLNNYRGKP